MGYNKTFIQSQALNASAISVPLQVGLTGLIDTVYSVEAVFNGSTCSFSAKIQVSSVALSLTPSPVPPPSNDPSWTDLANSSQTFTQAGNFMWNVNQVGYVWIQLVITDNSSGANNGTITATLNVNP